MLRCRSRGDLTRDHALEEIWWNGMKAVDDIQVLVASKMQWSWRPIVRYLGIGAQTKGLDFQKFQWEGQLVQCY